MYLHEVSFKLSCVNSQTESLLYFEISSIEPDVSCVSFVPPLRHWSLRDYYHFERSLISLRPTAGERRTARQARNQLSSARSMIPGEQVFVERVDPFSSKGKTKDQGAGSCGCGRATVFLRKEKKFPRVAEEGTNPSLYGSTCVPFNATV